MVMPLVVIREGNKTIYRIAKEDMSKYDEKKERDLTTSGAKLISNYDVNDEKWNKIFNKK